MNRLLRFALKALAIVLAVLSAAFMVLVYTMPVPVSKSEPRADNTRLREDVLRSRKVLFIGAHPDDIEFYAAGLIRMLRNRNADVVFAVATRGGKGRSGQAKRRLEGLRTRHQLDAARILGGARVVFYDYPDTRLPSYVSALTNDLIELIRSEKPDLVFCWDPDFIYNPHPDHAAAAQAAERAIEATDSRACFYGTRNPNLWVGYEEDVFRIKLKALRAHRTETPWPYFILGKRFLVKKSSAEGKKIGEKYAEVFRLTSE